MGLIARTIEAAGIATVSVVGLKEIAERVRPPRAVHVQWPFGHPLGEPGNRAQQLSVINYALKALATVEQPGTLLEPGWAWRRTAYSIPEAMAEVSPSRAARALKP